MDGCIRIFILLYCRVLCSFAKNTLISKSKSASINKRLNKDTLTSKRNLLVSVYSQRAP